MLRLLALCLLLSLVFMTDDAAAGSLKNFVFRDRDAFSWQLERVAAAADGIHIAYLQVYSGSWQRTEWNHRLRVIIPPDSRWTGVLLYVTGSGSGDSDLQLMGQIAAKSNCIVAILHDVPNQPLFGGLREDALIAHSFMRFFETRDSHWPALFPMTRSVVAAMDTLEELAREQSAEQLVGDPTDLKRFVISGASKRGWTTWLTAAVDDRVVGIIPAVYDNLNLPAQMKHQLTAWGEFSEQIRDYTELDIPQMLDSTEGLELAELVDPYAYRSSIAVPKLLLIGTNDRYWPVDAAKLYYDELVGPTYVHYVPNAGHSLNENELLQSTIASFAKANLNREQTAAWVDITWSFDSEGSHRTLTVNTSEEGTIRFWQATSSSRDFREAQWQSVSLHQNAALASHTYEDREALYQAVFAEVLVDDANLTYAVAVPVQVIPPR